MAARPWSPTPTSREPTQRFTPKSQRTWRVCSKLCRRFSTPGGIPSHVSVQTPGSIHEGGELGYVLSHAFGAAFDNPDLIVAAVVGDGEAESGPLAGAWKSTSFLNPAHDGAVLPILHLNGYKISGPTVLARDSDDDIRDLLQGNGYEVHFVEGDDPPRVHQAFAATLDRCYDRIRAIQQAARQNGVSERPRWPAIVLRTPKGWTGPKVVRRPAGRGHVSRAPGADGQREERSGPIRAARRVAAQLSPGGAVRRERQARVRAGRALRQRATGG